MTASDRRRRLTQRDLAILTQAHDDMVTPEFLLGRHFAGQPLTTVQAEIRKLCAASLLYSLPLVGRKRYYRLTRHGARTIQAHARHTRPLKRQGLIDRFALAWFFNVDQLDKSYRFDPSEWSDEFPQLANRRYWRRPFYLREDETTGKPRFGVVLIDHNASRRRLFAKVTDLLAELITCGWLVPFQEQNRLLVTLLTFNAGRAESLGNLLSNHLKSHLKSRGTENLVSLEVLCVPGLSELAIDTNPKETRR